MRRTVCFTALAVAGLITLSLGHAEDTKKRDPPDAAPPKGREPLAALIARLEAAKPEVLKRQAKLLEERYDLENKPAEGVTMSRGKPVQGGVRVRLPKGVTWEQ